eukprot:CAMPEP_0117883172 /NCGR_PEP_ID=MMETSP0950-20121206/17943_1 /TAXON_ID=44440 /ORGANISM="Chattonella subsalsa, Strain CCMP2191" /LENGTH=541 /DNA_ID=CAMNT_0005738931 /DNA_START=383 /DNA_END=2009 /DNA_ORIENTATION=-
MAVEQPSDSVEYIGNYLLNYVERKKKELKLEEAKAQVEELLQEAKQEEMARLEEQQVHQKAADEIEQKKKINYKENAATTSPESVFSEALTFVETTTRSTAVYLGQKGTTPAGEPAIDFLYTSQGGSNMKGQQLVAQAGGEDQGDDDEEGAVPKGPAPTFDLWKPLPEEPKEEEEEEPADETPKEPKYPEYIHIENVALNPRVDFLGGFPRLGAYAAVKVVYKTVMHDDGIQMVEETPASLEEESKEEGGEEKEGGEEEEGGGDAPSRAKTPMQPEIKWVKNTKDVEMCLSMHTMGQGRCYKEEEIGKAVEWGKHISEAMSIAEDKLFNEDVELLKKQKEETEADIAVLPEIKEKEEKGLAEFTGGLPDDMPAYERDFVEKCFIWDQARKRLSGIRARLLQYGLFSVPPKPAIMHNFVAMLILLGFSNEEIYNSVSQKPDWKKIRALVSPEVFTMLEKYDPKKDSFEPNEETRLAVLAQLEEVAAAGMALENGHLPIHCLQVFLEKSIKVEESLVQRRAALAEAAAAAAPPGEGDAEEDDS